MAHPYHEARHEDHRRANELVRKTGYRHLAHGGRVDEDEAEDKAMITKAVHEHEDHEHGGERTKLKLKHGGEAEGHKARHHLAKRARGGKAGHGKNTKVQVIVAPQGGGGGDAQAAHQQGMQQGAVMGARAMAAKMGAGAGGPGAGPVGGSGPPAPPAAGMAPSGPPMAPRPAAPPGGAPAGMIRAKGGRVEMEAGSGGGEGRIEKMHEYGKGGFKPKDRMS